MTGSSSAKAKLARAGAVGAVLVLAAGCDERPQPGDRASPPPLDATSPAPAASTPAAPAPGGLVAPPPPPGVAAVPHERFRVTCAGGRQGPVQLELRLFPEQGVAVVVRDGVPVELQAQGDGQPGTRWTSEAMTLIRTEAGWTLEQDEQPSLSCTRQGA